MPKRVPASQRTYETLRGLIEAMFAPAGAGTELIRLAAQLIIGEAVEAESRNVLGREYYEHRPENDLAKPAANHASKLFFPAIPGLDQRPFPIKA